MAADLASDKFWVNKYIYHDAEKTFYSSVAKEGVGMTNVSGDSYIKPSLAGEVAKTRELIKYSMEHVDGIKSLNLISKNSSNIQNNNNREISCLADAIKKLEKSFKSLEERVVSLENKCLGLTVVASAGVQQRY